MENRRSNKKNRRRAYQPVNTFEKNKTKKKKLVVENVPSDVAKEALKGERRGIIISKIFYYFIAFIGLVCALLNITDTEMHITLGAFKYDGSLVGSAIIIFALWRAEKADKSNVEIKNVHENN